MTEQPAEIACAPPGTRVRLPAGAACSIKPAAVLFRTGPGFETSAYSTVDHLPHFHTAYVCRKVARERKSER